VRKKLEAVEKGRRELDALIEPFIKESIKLCKSLAADKKYADACYIFHRLRALGLEEIRINEITIAFGNKSTDIVKPIPASTGAMGDDVEKIIQKAWIALKKKKHDEAFNACEEALKREPDLAEARLILFKIACDEKNEKEIRQEGLSYLLAPLRFQSAKEIEEVEKQVIKAAPELGPFFTKTAETVDEVLKFGKKILAGKKYDHSPYLALKLDALTHRTKAVETFLKKNPQLPWGMKLFDGRTWTGWHKPQGAVRRLGWFILTIPVLGRSYYNMYIKDRTCKSFTLWFTVSAFQKKGLLRDGGKTSYPKIGIGLREALNTTPGIMIHFSRDGKKTIRLAHSEDGAGLSQLAVTRCPGSDFVNGKWYKIRLDYVHGERGQQSKIMAYVNGKLGAVMRVPDNIASRMKRGHIQLGHQTYRNANFKDVYLAP
jgi:tetratricopeptide (TPR) repeat protein